MPSFVLMAAWAVFCASCEQPEKPEPYTYTHTFIVVYDANGGTGEMADSVFSYNKPQKLRKNTFTRDGYSFVGWSMSSTPTTYIGFGDEVVLLYAVWQKN